MEAPQLREFTRALKLAASYRFHLDPGLIPHIIPSFDAPQLNNVQEIVDG